MPGVASISADLHKSGYTAKGVALVIIGLLFLSAAWTHDPDKSGGLDQALSKLLQQPFGSPMLLRSRSTVSAEIVSAISSKRAVSPAPMSRRYLARMSSGVVDQVMASYVREGIAKAAADGAPRDGAKHEFPRWFCA